MLPNKLYFKKLIEIIDKLATISIYDYKSHLKKTIQFFYMTTVYITYSCIFVTMLKKTLLFFIVNTSKLSAF